MTLCKHAYDTWNYYGSAGTYSGFDRFGRVVQQLWRYYGGTPADRDKFLYAYDRNSNRATKDLTLTAGLDEKYAYDSLNRLTSYDRSDFRGPYPIYLSLSSGGPAGRAGAAGPGGSQDAA